MVVRRPSCKNLIITRILIFNIYKTCLLTGALEKWGIRIKVTCSEKNLIKSAKIAFIGICLRWNKIFSPWEVCFHGTWPSLSSPYYVDRAVAVSCITVMLGPTLQLGPQWSPGEGPRLTRHTSQCRVQGTSSERDGLSPSVTGLDWVNMLRGYVTIRSSAK